MINKPTAIFILWEQVFNNIYSLKSLRRIKEDLNVLPRRLDMRDWCDHKECLADVEYIFSGWGMAVMDEAFLNATPKLKHVFYGAGGVRGFYTDMARARGVTLSSAWRANAVPVAEFSHATIILALKKFWRIHRSVQANRKWDKGIEVPGAFHTTVGLLSLGAIGRLVARHLQNNDLKVIAYDPYASAEQAAELNVELVSLERLFQESDVVSIHAPNLPATVGMVSGSLLRSMKQGASLINTARGQVIDEPAMVEVLHEREDLDVILDVTATEPDNTDSPLWDLPNVVLTPHIAGSMDKECRRMGEYMVEEWERYRNGQPLQHEVTELLLRTMA